MDQNSFRTFLTSAPAPREGTGRAAGVLGTTALKRGVGGKSGTKVKDLQRKEEKPFVPRKISKKNDKYQDRAEMRRLGQEDEFNEMEKMLAEFEKSAREAGETEEEIATKRAYLGGDATHSILVKGLDFSLLAARKAELVQEAGGKAEDELDDLLDKGIGGSGAELDDLYMDESQGKGKKRGLEELFDGDVKKKKKKVKVLDGTQATDPAKSALPSKFKSIGAATAAASETKPKKKKKKKLKAEPVEDGAGDSASTVQAKVVELPVAGPSKPLAAAEPPRPMSPHTVTIKSEDPVEEEEEEEEEDDIFGGVGTYDNPLDESEDDSDEDKPTREKPTDHSEKREEGQTEGRTAPLGKQGKGWFGDDADEDEGLNVPTNALQGVNQSLAKNKRSSREDAASGSDSDSNDVHKPLARLHGLSSSALPSAKELLALDAAASAADKRREKKAKWRAKQGLAAQDQVDDDDEEGGGRGKGADLLNEKQKLNRDVQQLSAYMEKREKKSGEGK